MKLQYIKPETTLIALNDELMLVGGSVKQVGGDSGISIAGEDESIPSSSDSKGFSGGLWDLDE